jgi:hypothetical protein
VSELQEQIIWLQEHKELFALLVTALIIALVVSVGYLTIKDL